MIDYFSYFFFKNKLQFDTNEELEERLFEELELPEQKLNEIYRGK